MTSHASPVGGDVARRYPLDDALRRAEARVGASGSSDASADDASRRAPAPRTRRPARRRTASARRRSAAARAGPAPRRARIRPARRHRADLAARRRGGTAPRRTSCAARRARRAARGHVVGGAGQQPGARTAAPSTGCPRSRSGRSRLRARRAPRRPSRRPPADSSRTVRRGVPYVSATSAISSETTRAQARLVAQDRLAAPRSRGAAARCSFSSSIRENLVSRRSRSSRMYSACSSDRSKISRRRSRAVSASSDVRMTWMTSSMSSDRDEQALDEVQALLPLGQAVAAVPAPDDVDAVVHPHRAAARRSPSVRGWPSTSATLLMPKESSSGVYAVQLLEHGVGVEAGLDLDDQAQPVLAVGEVHDVADAGELLGLARPP